jgi:hypothetical protein
MKHTTTFISIVASLWDSLRLLRRLFARAPGVACGLILLSAMNGQASPASLRIETNPHTALIDYLSWDTEGGGRSAANLLQAGTGAGLRVRLDRQWQAATNLPTRREMLGKGGVRYRLTPGTDAELVWEIKPAADRLKLSFRCRGTGWKATGGLELTFAFDPRVTPTTVLPGSWDAGGELRLPAVVNAPDFGQMLLACEGASEVKARLEGNRAQHQVKLVVELPNVRPNQGISLSLVPVYLAAPRAMRDKDWWVAARRGWFGAFQPSAKWGDSGNPFSAPAGMLANNVISDPASCSLWFYADQAFWTPELAPGVSAMAMVRRTVDWWLAEKVLPTGEMICYWDKTHFLDANAGPLIAAWDYVEATGDKAWLKQRIERLEFIADFLAARDVDGDGLVEATQSGNYGTLQQPGRSCAWWDAVNCGHKEAYCNALIYRAWRCLADLEAKAGRRAQHERYDKLANRLKAGYAKTFFNPQTGWLGWWRSADGELHDYAAPTVNGLAIEYGLVEAVQGREILARLRAKMQEVGFSRFDLGIPTTLIPIHRGDYLLPDAAGCPKREDGSDTFGFYMNGGISAGQALHFIMAHYVVGERQEADKILRAMLARQSQGGFQNGVVNQYPEGIDWTTWDGKPAGYEGYLADSFRFLQAVVLREPAARARLYRPLGAR